jgi:DNA polymerase III subunit epsilon
MVGSFIAIDFETANRERASICQIGLVGFSDGAISWEWSSLVNPECDFDDVNVRIHGIQSLHVRSAPTWPAILNEILPSIQGQFLVSHTRFDCEAFHAASNRYEIQPPNCHWVDSCDVTRKVWPDLPQHKLKFLCEKLGVHLTHHDALSDARACGTVFLHAMSATGLGISD